MTNAESIVLGSLLADAICLGPHWVYDQARILHEIKDPGVFHDPISPYHPGKKAGELTHYGDQVLLLLAYLSATREKFHLPGYADTWQAYWNVSGTISYRDGATKGTLANLEQGMPPEQAGAASHDLAGATIIAPLFLRNWADDSAFIAAVRALTAFTHNQAEVVDAAEFVARVVLAADRGHSIPDALTHALEATGNVHLRQWYKAGETSAASTVKDSAALAAHGLGCDINGGFAGMCHLLLRYADNPLSGLVQNAVAGGDSSARGMLMGMIYGAGGFVSLLPVQWKNELKCHPVVQKLMREALHH